MAVQPAPEDQGGITEAAAGFLEAITETGHAFTAGKFVRFDGTNWVKANADTAAHAGDEYRTGFVDALLNTTNEFYLRTGGLLTFTGHGFTTGKELYLNDDIDGDLTEDPSTDIASGAVMLKVGYVIDANTISVDIDNAYVTE